MYDTLLNCGMAKAALLKAGSRRKSSSPQLPLQLAKDAAEMGSAAAALLAVSSLILLCPCANVVIPSFNI